MAQPHCPYFSQCGGCTSQHVDYSLQLENKKKTLAGIIKFKDIQIFSGKEYHYRHRLDFIFHPQGLGLRAKKKNSEIVDIEECLISNEQINKLLKEVREFFISVDAFDLKKRSGTFRYAVIRTTTLNDSSLSFVLNENSLQLDSAIEKINAFAQKTTAKNVLITYVPAQIDESISDNYFMVKGKDLLKENFLEQTFYYPVQGFFQNNPQLAQEMFKYIHDLLKSYHTKPVFLLDLYGGVGPLGIINAELFQRVTIVEGVPSSIEAAKKNILENKISNTRAILLDAKNIKKINFSPLLFVITDPPRSGMDQKTIQYLKELKPKVIIYISCNPRQLGKDLLKFKEYELKSAALFDLFPQTNHLEAAVELKLKDF